MTSSDEFEWEYLVRLNVKGEFIMQGWADDKSASKQMAYDQMREVLPGWCAIQIEEAKRADPPSMRFFLRNIERTEGDDE